MRLYDSLSKQIKDVTDDPINIYNCGPTVYNHIHIGNARPLIVFDVLFRTLKAQGLNVNYLHNLTNIDDKIIKAAQQENIPELELSDKYGKAYEEIRRKLNTLDMTIETVSDNMDGIIDYVGRMLKNGGAYEYNGNVYFDTSKISDYGILSNRQIDEQIHGERVSKDDAKKNESDFVLWKNTNEGIKWQTPWSLGRPGWHSECSYLIEKHFANNLTIHGGGIDLKFPHHENENAQHMCLHNQPLAKIWMHVGHVNINQQKMSKSLNNFILVKDILNELDYRVVRWFMYQTNYRNPIDYNDTIIEQCKKDIAKLTQVINTTKTALIANDQLNLSPTYSKEFIDELNDDLNITNAITIIYELVKKLNISVRAKDFQTSSILLNYIVGNLSILGIEFENIHTESEIKRIKEYYQLVANKQFEKADIIRNDLIKKGLM